MQILKWLLVNWDSVLLIAMVVALTKFGFNIDKRM